jgi:hypothetical protein
MHCINYMQSRKDSNYWEEQKSYGVEPQGKGKKYKDPG